ncbi:unnamed protein product [Gongylonema pulchrum]|uniref:Uncharacterized protein n=1 Tax=Gongylonema pulchrum TaxID=637853 RepID=A0A183DRL9_9BILA|nr:unnamed protein product [Gongylonema pulchrum]
MHRLKQQIVMFLRRIWPPADGLCPTFALNSDLALTGNSSGRLMQVEDIIDRLRVALGVPKIRTCDAKKVTRKFDCHRLLQLKKNLVVCQHCGSYHEFNRICEKQSTNVKFDDDARPHSQNIRGHPVADATDTQRIVELGIPRPTWFKPKFFDNSFRDDKH